MTDKAASGKRSIPKSSIILLCLFIVYLALTFIGAARHEIWYDEAQAWNIAKYNDISGIIDFMKYEGHPPAALALCPLPVCQGGASGGYPSVHKLVYFRRGCRASSMEGSVQTAA